MRLRVLPLVVLLVPLASAHGASSPFDPLVVEMHAFLHADLRLDEAPPAAGALAFPPSTPAAPGAPLAFEFSAPVRFAPAGGVLVELRIRADAAVATGDGLELVVEPGGAPRRVALAPIFAPGDLASASVVLEAGPEYAKGEIITLSVRALAPALAEGALSLLIGPDASRVDVLDMRVPKPADLELQEASLIEFLVDGEQFSPSRPATVHTIRVSHAAVSADARSGTDANATFAVLIGAESEADAKMHAFPDRVRRVAAAHVFTVDGVLARVHPGLGVVVPVTSLPARMVCVANCPQAGYSVTIGGDGAPVVDDRPSSLVPPTRETRNIPVSADEPPTKGTPGFVASALVATGLLLALVRRRRR